MVAACRTALVRAGGGERGVGKDSERAAHGQTGVSGRREVISFTGGGGTETSKEVGKRGLEMKALGGWRGGGVVSRIQRPDC